MFKAGGENFLQQNTDHVTDLVVATTTEDGGQILYKADRECPSSGEFSVRGRGESLQREEGLDSCPQHRTVHA